MSITEFLLARIAEDERHVEFVRGFIPDEHQGECIDPNRVLAECEAKRRIVWLCAQLWTLDQTGALTDIPQDLAAVYADHPDYREEWRV